jgi:hypothetical protein
MASHVSLSEQLSQYQNKGANDLTGQFDHVAVRELMSSHRTVSMPVHVVCEESCSSALHGSKWPKREGPLIWPRVKEQTSANMVCDVPGA